MGLPPSSGTRRRAKFICSGPSVLFRRSSAIIVRAVEVSFGVRDRGPGDIGEQKAMEPYRAAYSVGAGTIEPGSKLCLEVVRS